MYKCNLEGLEKRARFIVIGLVKLASEPSTELMWLQASCKAASTLTTQGSTQALCRAQMKAGFVRLWLLLCMLPGSGPLVQQQQQVSFPIYGKTLL